MLVICVINSSRHKKCFVRGYTHSLFVSMPSYARTSPVRVLTQTTREYKGLLHRTFYDVNYISSGPASVKRNP